VASFGDLLGRSQYIFLDLQLWATEVDEQSVLKFVMHADNLATARYVHQPRWYNP
jgi:hypothetical protein